MIGTNLIRHLTEESHDPSPTTFADLNVGAFFKIANAYGFVGHGVRDDLLMKTHTGFVTVASESRSKTPAGHINTFNGMDMRVVEYEFTPESRIRKVARS